MKSNVKYGTFCYFTEDSEIDTPSFEKLYKQESFTYFECERNSTQIAFDWEIRTRIPEDSTEEYIKAKEISKVTNYAAYPCYIQYDTLAFDSCYELSFILVKDDRIVLIKPWSYFEGYLDAYKDNVCNTHEGLKYA